ncbi:polysaccharide biosynthesis tyrosine autokinase [Mameliella sp.]|uniref:polysaccharide biosynthesis tyrosine autokinase n=1 Tax=Mameliella sp. TaxID=1924940 RepID=UPI003BACEE36
MNSESTGIPRKLAGAGARIDPLKSEEAPSFDLLNLIGILWRGKIIIAAFALMLAVYGVYVAMTATPFYSASTRLMLSGQNAQVVNLESVASGLSMDYASINTELEVIASRKLVEQLVRDLDLVNDPDFNPYLGTGGGFSLRQLISLALNYIRDQAPPEPEAPASREEQIQRTVTVVQRTVKATAPRYTYLVDVSVTTQDPKKAMTLANRLAELYIEDQVRKKFEATRFAIDFLSNQVTELKTELEDQENAVKTLRAESDLISPEALDQLNVRLREAERRAADAAADLDQMRNRLAEARALRDEGRIDELITRLNDPQLRLLINRGIEIGNPAISARIDTVLADLEQDITREESRLSALKESAATLAEESREQTADLLNLNDLLRESEATRILYETFLARLKEATVQTELQRADSRILSEAVDARLVAPQKSRIALFWTLVGGLIGIAIVMARHFMPSGMRTAGELELMTAMPVVGQIPRIKLRKRKALFRFIRNNPTAPIAEAVRNLRTSLLLSDIDHPPQVVMLTSSVPGEGKTTLAFYLAQQFGAINKRTLLVEADLRRRTFREYVDNPSKTGFTSVMLGDATIEQSITHIEDMDFDLLLADRSTYNAADLFTSERYAGLMRDLRERYDVIIIDTPPVLVVPDARLIGMQADTSIYLSRWDKTPPHQIQDGLKLLQSDGVNVAGTVLTQIDPKGMKRYGYGNRYGAYANYGSNYYGRSD